MFDKLIRYLVERSGKTYSVKYRMMATVLGAALFLAGWPLLIALLGWIFPGLVFSEGASKFVSIVLFILGVPWVVWSVAWQLWKGEGTPVPAVPTKHFLQSGPYRYVRNPMMLGFFFYLSGWAAWINQAGACFGALLLIALLIAEIKLVEEKELEKRFGDAYRQYKKEVPFFVPKFK